MLTDPTGDLQRGSADLSVLSAAQVGMLAKGFDFRKVSPQNLVSYCPMIDGNTTQFNDLCGGAYAITGTATYGPNNPTIIRPGALKSN